jgi:hypothetical protein
VNTDKPKSEMKRQFLVDKIRREQDARRNESKKECKEENERMAE